VKLYVVTQQRVHILSDLWKEKPELVPQDHIRFHLNNRIHGFLFCEEIQYIDSKGGGGM
jgi:hypothetical protein